MSERTHIAAATPDRGRTSNSMPVGVGRLFDGLPSAERRHTPAGAVRDHEGPDGQA
jgi:hypothetical protein